MLSNSRRAAILQKMAERTYVPDETPGYQAAQKSLIAGAGSKGYGFAPPPAMTAQGAAPPPGMPAGRPGMTYAADKPSGGGMFSGFAGLSGIIGGKTQQGRAALGQ